MPRITLAYPERGTQICVDVDDSNKVAMGALIDKRLGQDIDGAILGQKFAGYIFRLGGGNDKQGFPMKQGVLTTRRVRLLLKPGATCYRPRVAGERKRKSVRGCIVSPDIAALHMIVVKKGDGEIPGLTDTEVKRLWGPKRASKIRRAFGVDKGVDLRRWVVRHQTKSGKMKEPKIQRLVTPARLQRKSKEKAQREAKQKLKEQRTEAYRELLAQQKPTKQRID